MSLLLTQWCLCACTLGYVWGQQGFRSQDDIPIFYSLKSVLDRFHSVEHAGRPETQKILYAFENYCFNQFTKPVQFKRKPFIVIEGDHKTSTDIISRRLARRIGATLMQNVAKCLEPYKRVFSKEDPLRRAFYGLSMYANAHKAKQVFNRFPVITNGFWAEQTVFGVGNRFLSLEQVPLKGDPIYTWPADLLKPDLIVYITFPDNFHIVGTTRPPNAWKNRLEYIYRQIQDPPVVFHSTAAGFDNVTADIETIIQAKFAGELDVNFRPNYK